MKRFSLIILAFSCIAASPSPIPVKSDASTRASHERRLQELHAKIGSVEQLSARFSQTVFRSLRKTKRESSGKAYFGAPNKFRWILEVPAVEEFRFDGTNLLQIKPDEKIASRFRGMSEQTKDIEQIVAMVLDLKSLTNRYDLESFEKKDKINTITLTPKRAEADLISVEIDVLEPQFVVSRVKMNYQTNYTEISFTHVEKSAPANIFSEPLPGSIKIKDIN